MSFFNMFSGAPKKEDVVKEPVNSLSSNDTQCGEAPARADLAVDMETLEVKTPSDLAEEKEIQKIPESWREQA